MDSIFNFAINQDKDEFSLSKKDVLKFLKIIGVDTRFISYTSDKIYINNLRFSKFSKKRQHTFNKQYPNIEVVRNSLFQKICSKASRVLADEIKPNSRILIPKNNELVEIILESYTRKYGVTLVFDGDFDLIANPIILDDKVNSIFCDIFRGDGLTFSKKDDEIYPLINVPLDWINSFLEMDGKKIIETKDWDDLSTSFMEFLEDVAPQYRENVLKAYTYIEKELEAK